MTTVNGISFGAIRNVRKSGDEENVYFADVEISPEEGFPFDVHLYCARGDDYAATGKWVYAQITSGNHEGTITQLAANVNPQTGEPWPEVTHRQPLSRGAQTL
jgi:hypothetical protein